MSDFAKCPECGGRAILVDAYFVCQECGYYEEGPDEDHAIEDDWDDELDDLDLDDEGEW